MLNTLLQAFYKFQSLIFFSGVSDRNLKLYLSFINLIKLNTILRYERCNSTL